MDYKYHVEVSEHIGNIDRTITSKYNTFKDAYTYFNMNVSILRKDHKINSWEITIYDMEALEVKFYITNIDFSDEYGE